MRQLALLVLTTLFSFSALAAGESEEKPTQHLQVAEVQSMQEAKAVFLDKTAEIRSKLPLTLENASHIHIITYTLEKSVAYFADNLEGDKKALAEEMAVVVEDIHITSESNRLGELKEHLDKYFALVDEFVFCF